VKEKIKMAQNSHKRKPLSLIGFFKTYWTIILLFSVGLLVILYLSNSYNPFTSERLIKNREVINTNFVSSYRITESVLEAKFGSTLPDIRNYEYFFEYSLQHQKTLGDGTANFKTLFMFTPIIGLFQPVIKTKSREINKEFIVISNESILINKMFDETVSNSFLELADKGIIRQGVVNVLLIKDDTTSLRIFILKTDNVYTKEEITSQYSLSMTEKNKIINLLVNMANNVR